MDAALGRVGAIRTQVLKVTAQLQQKEADLAAARRQLAERRAELARTRRSLARARSDLGNLLVFIYKNPGINEAAVVLNAHGLDDLATRAEYLATEGYEIKGETFAIQHNEEHRFFYAKDMTPDEAMFIKCFDSRGEGLPGGKEGLARCTPHTAFVDPQTPESAPGRQSIEVRCLIFYE